VVSPKLREGGSRTSGAGSEASATERIEGSGGAKPSGEEKTAEKAS
jgi:hypothetical protein